MLHDDCCCGKTSINFGCKPDSNPGLRSPIGLISFGFDVVETQKKHTQCSL